MKLSTLLVGCILMLPVAALAQLDQPHTRIEATFDQPVKVNADKTLPPGQYIFQQERTQSEQAHVFRIEDPSGKQVALTSPPIKAVYSNWEGAAGGVPKHNTVMIKKVGDNAYLDYVWFQGMPDGYHFTLAPKNSKGQEITINAGSPGQ